MLNRAARYLLAALQAIIGWEWLASGTVKVLSGTFPQGLAETIRNGFRDNPNTWYVSFLQSFALPHSIFIGYFIEWAEVTIGLALLAGALILLGQPRMRGEAQHRLVVAFCAATALLAVVGAFLTVNFHFWMGRGIMPGVPGDLNDEAIDLDALVPPLSIVILIANLAYIKLLRGETWYSRLYARIKAGLRRFIGIEDVRTEAQKQEAVS